MSVFTNEPKAGDLQAFRQNDRWWAAGEFTSGIANLTIASTTFDTFLLALPTQFSNAGTITDLAFYLSGDATAKGWVGVFDTARDASGNFIPHNRLGSFESIPGSVDGNLLRSGSVSIPVPSGTLLWFVVQLNATTASAASANQPAHSIGGQDLGATAATTQQPKYTGWRTSAATTYNSALTTFPTAGIQALKGGGGVIVEPLLIGGTNTGLVPAVFFKFRQS